MSLGRAQVGVVSKQNPNPVIASLPSSSPLSLSLSLSVILTKTLRKPKTEGFSILSLSKRTHRKERQRKDMDSDEGKLFIGGIAWDTSEETLTEYFTQYG